MEPGRDVGVVRKDNVQSRVGMEVAAPVSTSWLWFHASVLEVVTTRGKWVNGTRDFSAFFVTTSWELQLSHNEKFDVKRVKD